jgi:AcrR family transcriptional regulator
MKVAATRRSPRRGLAPKVRMPLQARSRATFDRLLSAAVALLAERRFEEASVAELVRRAGSSVGAFYARFESKEALLHELDVRLFEVGRAKWKEFLAPERWEGASASAILSEVVSKLVDTRRERRGLLRALALYVRSRPGSEFARRSAKLNRLLTERLTELMLTRRSEIGHPRPGLAIAFALEIVDSVTRDAILFADAGLAPARLSDTELKAELLRALTLYLRLEED